MISFVFVAVQSGKDDTSDSFAERFVQRQAH